MIAGLLSQIKVGWILGGLGLPKLNLRYVRFVKSAKLLSFYFNERVYENVPVRLNMKNVLCY